MEYASAESLIEKIVEVSKELRIKNNYVKANNDYIIIRSEFEEMKDNLPCLAIGKIARRLNTLKRKLDID